MNLARQRALIGFSQVGRTLPELPDAKGGGPLLVREAGLRFLMLVFQGGNPGRARLILRGVWLRLSDWKRSHQSRRASAGAGAAAAPESVNSMAAVPSRQPRPCCVHSVLESRKEITLLLPGTGNSTVMAVPSPSRLSSFSWAPCSRAMCFTMASPRPVPPVALLRLLSTR